jgi:hypothetical protein
MLRIIGLLLLLNAGSLLRAGGPAPLPLHGGCITTPTQYLVFGNVPGAINATAASDGVAGTYQYQWQRSVDDINFVDIAGATSQNLSFSGPLSQTTWFQRKTVSGAEVAYTGKVAVVMASTIFYNVAKSGTFTRNTCSSGSSGTTVTYTVPANTYVSIISQADADSKAQNDVNNFGQTYANNNGNCIWYSAEMSTTFTRNNCGSNYIGSSVTYTVAAGAYNSTISQADANQKALNDVNANGQTYANNNGSCTPTIINVYATNWTSTYFNAYFTNTATNMTYTFFITPGMNNQYCGQVPPGTYNLAIYTQAGGNLEYEWWVGSHYAAFYHSLVLDNWSVTSDYDASIAIADY